jgi:hypothetical protein
LIAMYFPEYVAVAMAERERRAELDRLAQFAPKVRACCNTPFVMRVVAALRRTPAPCGC